MTSPLSRNSRTVQLFSLPIRLLLILFLWSTWAHAQEHLFDSNLSSQDINPVPSLSQDNTLPGPLWQYGAYLDLGYSLDFNFPDNHRWRSKPTSPRVNDLALNMALGYVQKKTSVRSRWGMEFGVQGGRDTQGLVSDPRVGGADTLRHFYRANLSYLVPVGNGLTLTTGLFNSYIGYNSFLAKNNLTYTRAYIADQSPYFMFGIAADYPVNQNLAFSVYSVNGFSYLAHPNNAFSYGGQIVWKPIADFTFTQNLYYGPDQGETALEFWRFFSDSIVEWKGTHGTLAFIVDVGTEKQANIPNMPRFIWMGSALEGGWHISGPWSVAFRPEVYWDPQGLITGQEQLIRAITTTLEYKFRMFSSLNSVFRLEYRFDESTGSGGGFFKNGRTRAGVMGLTPTQHLLLFGFMWWFDDQK